MDFEFSDKYEPLFKLLEAWNQVSRFAERGITKGEFEEYKTTRQTIIDGGSPNEAKDSERIFELFKKGLKGAELNEALEWWELAGVHTVLISGGRDSGKSFALSTFNGVASHDYEHRILYTRQTMSSTDNSITEALENRLVSLNIAQDYEVSNKLYQLKPLSDGTPRKGKISITGQKTSVGTQTAKLKSLEDFSIFETDEGEELESLEGWKKTDRSIRAQDVQCISIIIFNPPTKEHFIYEEWYEDVPEGFNGIINGVLYIHTTYKDNGRENMAEKNWNEYERLRISYELYLSTPASERDSLDSKIVKAYKQYKFEILGGFKDVAEGVIYEDWRIGEFNPDNLPYLYGHDFGSNDPDATTKVAVDHDKLLIYIDEMFFKSDVGTGELMRTLYEIIGTEDLIIGDSAERRLIKDFQGGMYGDDGEWYSGLNIQRVKKSSRGSKDNFVRWSIKKCQSYTLVITPRSKNVIKAVKNYVWHDKRAGVPNHDYSDIMDSWRYAAIEVMP